MAACYWMTMLKNCYCHEIFDDSRSNHSHKINLELLFEGLFYDWFVTKEFINNKTGNFYIGMVSLKLANPTDRLLDSDEASCADSGIMNKVKQFLMALLKVI